jgi:hypothetical protein
MNVYDFAPDLDLSKEGEGSIFGGERNRRQ